MSTISSDDMSWGGRSQERASAPVGERSRRARLPQYGEWTQRRLELEQQAVQQARRAQISHFQLIMLVLAGCWAFALLFIGLWLWNLPIAMESGLSVRSGVGPGVEPGVDPGWAALLRCAAVWSIATGHIVFLVFVADVLFPAAPALMRWGLKAIAMAAFWLSLIYGCVLGWQLLM